VDVLQVDVPHPGAGCPGHGDRVGSSHHQVPGIEADGGGALPQEAVDLVGGLDDGAVVRMQGEEEAFGVGDLLQFGDRHRQVSPFGVGEVGGPLVPLGAGGGGDHRDLPSGGGDQANAADGFFPLGGPAPGVVEDDRDERADQLQM